VASNIRNTRLYRRVSDFIVAMLVKEHGSYAQRFPNDIGKLRASLRPGDVILVEGSQRISQIIKYLTQSSWSHAALYVGDSVIKGGGADAATFRREYGPDADALLVEANAETGVTAVPLAKYQHHNIRICRPINLRPDDLTIVLTTVTAQLGAPYNVGHIMDLLRYFLPVSLIGFGRGPLRVLDEDGDGMIDSPRDVICSSQIAMAFQKVRYPIQPTYSTPHASAPTSFVQRVSRRVLPGGKRFDSNFFDTGVFTPCDPRLVTPRDFDLSPYFEVVKLPGHDRRDFDYKKLKWAGARVNGNGATAEVEQEVPVTDQALPAS
jgi:hypothetical protein